MLASLWQRIREYFDLQHPRLPSDKERAAALAAAINYVCDGHGDRDWLVDWNYGDPVAMQQLDEWRAANRP